MRKFIASITLCLFVSGLARADEYDDLRLKWRDTIVGAGYDVGEPEVVSKLSSIASSANSYWSSMDKSPTRTYLWSDAASTTVSADLTTCYSRLRAMSLAYATPGCSLEGNATLLADILGGLDWMYAHRYNETTTIYDNWYQFEIGVPLQLTDMAVLLYDQLDQTRMDQFMGTVEKFTPSATTQAPGGTSGTFTGANRMWKIRVVAVRGAVVKNSAKLAAARDAFSELFQYVTSGDGFYEDGSFIQHTIHPYTAGYGAALLVNMAPVMNWLAGSTWEVTDSSRANVFRWVFESFEPIIYRGAAWDLVRGREITRSSSSPQGTGHSIADSILQIAQFAPEPAAARMKSLVKEWALSDTVRDFVGGRPLPTLALAKNLMNDASVPRRGELTGHYTFAEMDRVVHLGRGYGFGLSMCSTRIANFESINGENLHGWFTGDGMTILYNADLSQLTDSYWPTVDAWRMPGVTADVTHNKLPAQSASIGPRAQGQGTRSPHAWVGGATLGQFGAAGMEFKGVGVTLTGRKSWFMFDDEIVCLGAGITSTDNRPIETTVENRKLSADGANAFIMDGVPQSTALGWSGNLSGVNWAHLAGPVSGSDIGYYFPQPATLKAVREARTGSWADVDDGSSSSPITRNYLRMSFEHGSNPGGASYQYVLLPGRNARQMQYYAAAPQVSVIANTATMQAVNESTLGITAANFWTDTQQTAGIITANKKCSVVVQDDGTFVDVAVSDPTQLNAGSIALQIDLDGHVLVRADPGVAVTQVSPSIVLGVNVASSAGKTFTARFYKGTPQGLDLNAEADAYVYDVAASVDSNFGTANSLVVKKSGTGFNRESFLRFDVPAINGVLLGASLKLQCLSASDPGMHGVFVVPDNGWIESGAGSITWNNRPSSDATPLSTWLPETGVQAVADVTAAVTGAGLKSFRVAGTTQTSNGYVTYGSREQATTTSRPQLSLVVGHVPPIVALAAPADGAFVPRAGNVTLEASVVATDGAIVRVDFYDGGILLGSDLSEPFEFVANLRGGLHEFTVVATDANSLSRTSLVSRIEVAHPPMAQPGNVKTPQDAAIDVDLRTLVTDADTATAELLFELGTAQNGSVALLADGHTARFTPAAGYNGPATFGFTVTDTSADPRLLFNYAFQNADLADSSGLGRTASLNILGTGAAGFSSDVPSVLMPHGLQSLVLTENGTSGAARLERSLGQDVIDLQNADWSITGWFKRATASNQDSIVQLGNSGGFASDAMTLAYYGSAATLYLRNYDGTTQDVNSSVANVATAQWHHFAIVRNGGTLSWYLDGAPAGSDSSFQFGLNNTSPVKFGGVATNFPDRWLNGSLADLAMFSVALSEQEIQRTGLEPVKWFGGQTATATVNVQVLSPFRQWAEAHELMAPNDGPAADADGDGRSNLEEYITGTNPKVMDAGPRLGITAKDGAILVSFTVPGVSGAGYTGLTRLIDLLRAPDVPASMWEGVDDFTGIVADDTTLTFTNAAPGVSGFYRLRIRLE